MITVVNFSHPLEDNRPDVIDLLGEEYRVIAIPVQVNQDASMATEIEPIYQATIEAVNGNSLNIDCVVLPGLAIVAVMMVARFRQGGYMPHVLRLAPVPGSMPHRFEAAELIKSYLL